MSFISNPPSKNIFQNARLVWTGTATTVNFTSITDYADNKAYLVKMQDSANEGPFALLLPYAGGTALENAQNASYKVFASGYQIANVERNSTSFVGRVINGSWGSTSPLVNTRALLEVWDLGEVNFL